METAMTVIHSAAFASRTGPRCSVFHGLGLFSALIYMLALTGSLVMLQVYDQVLPSHSVSTRVALTLFTAAQFLVYDSKALTDQMQRALREE